MRKLPVSNKEEYRLDLAGTFIGQLPYIRIKASKEDIATAIDEGKAFESTKTDGGSIMINPAYIRVFE